MITKANMHLGFNCKDLEKSMWWYETFLGCKEKFTLYWGDLLPKDEEMRSRMDPERIAYLESIKDDKWIVYMEVMDCPGTFIELFNEPTAHIPHLPDQAVDLNYTHYAHTVDDVEAFCQSVLEKGGEEYIWLTPRLNIDRTKAMWLMDPDGNKMEFIEYNEYSMELIGRDLPEGVDFFGKLKETED